MLCQFPVFTKSHGVYNNFEDTGIAFHESLSLDPSHIRGQAYDEASVMSFGNSGVQAKIKRSLHWLCVRTAIATALVCL